MLKNKFKLVAFLTLALSYSSFTFASGWLAGLEVGYGSRTHKLNTSTVIASNALAAATGVPLGGTLASNKVEFTDNGSVWGAVVGYEWDYHPMWLASLELRFNYDNFGTEQQFQYADSVLGANLLTSTVKFDRGPMLELSARFGIKTHRNWIPYVRLGGFASNDELIFATTIINGGAVIGNDSVSKSDRQYGYLVGVGFELPLFRDNIYRFLRCTVVRAEYNYLRPQRYILDDVYPPLNGRYTTRPVEHLFKAALVFKPL